MLEGVVFRVQVVLQLGRGPEVFLAVGAPVVLVAVVFLELLVAVEELYIRQNCPPLRKREKKRKKRKDSGSRGQRGITDLATLSAGVMVFHCVLPQLIFVVKVTLTICAKVMI
jgi:hypothetical protein